MPDNKDVNDNWSGAPKFVQKKWAQQKREAARKKKLEKMKKKRGEQ